jgi:nitroreductase
MSSAVSHLVEAMPMRCSTRTFDGRPVATELSGKLMYPEQPRTLGLASCRTVLLHDPAGFDAVFTGIVGSYGKIRGATAILVLLAPADSGNRGQLEAGHLGEQYVLAATALGIASCWVGGTFNYKALMTRFSIAPDEAVVSIIALGYPKVGKDAFAAVLHTFVPRKNLSQIAAPNLLRGSPWLRAALEAVRIAPSAVNLQPWHFSGTEEQVVLKPTRKTAFTHIDLGIAMLHFALAAEHAGINGQWAVAGDNFVFIATENSDRAKAWLPRTDPNKSPSV